MNRSEQPFGHATDPRPSATVVVLRDGPSGLEVLLTLRPRHFRFMGGASVFPGGAVDPGDRDPAWESLSVRSPGEAAAALDMDDPELALAYHVCALREAFEEVSLWLGDGPPAIEADDAERPGAFFAAVESGGFPLRTDLIHAAGRGITPLGSPVRFDTRFFLAEAPRGWEPAPRAGEVEACTWWEPRHALRGSGVGELLMSPPTVEMLTLLSPFATVAEAVEGSVAVGDPSGAIWASRVSPGVMAILAPNAGLMTGPGTNTYVVGDSDASMVIDPAVEDPEFIEVVLREAGTVEAILITHRHDDHTGGADALAKMTGAPVRAFGDRSAGSAEVVPLGDGETIGSGRVRLKALHTPGHSSDHMCFWDADSKGLFSGDAILGEGTAVIGPPDGNMKQYLSTLERLDELGVGSVFPGHFRARRDGAEVIKGYIAHRAARSAAILKALEGRALGVEEIVAAVYTDVSPELYPVAALSVGAQLELLAEQGKVVAVDDRWARREMV
ncbi:MAG TPA: MBL fold metallo-hydrolase [Actinomycetota bacterium]|nr:MBL fold metallo-hydrolase [Actinomycetota bacterium]